MKRGLLTLFAIITGILFAFTQGDPCNCIVPVGGVFCDDGGNGIDCPGGSTVSYDIATDTYTLVSENCYSGSSTREKLAFASTELCGNGELIAKVSSISPTGGFAGIMMRSNRNPVSMTALLYIDGNTSTVYYDYRSWFIGTLIDKTTTRSGVDYLKLVRTGSNFKWYTKAGSGPWEFLYSRNMLPSSCIEAGIVTSNFPQHGDLTVTATFTEVQLINDQGNALPDCPTSVSFGTNTAIVNEGENVQICLNISDPSATAATELEVALTSATSPHFDNYITQTITFPTGSNDPQCFNLQTDAANGIADNNFTYTFAIQNVTGGDNAAIGSIDELTVTVNEELLPELLVGDDQSICPGECVQLGSSIGENSSYCFKWISEHGEDEGTLPRPNVCPEKTTTYKVYILGDQGLIATEQVTVVVNC